MNHPGSPRSDSLTRPFCTKYSLVSILLRFFFIKAILAGMTGLTLAAPAMAAQGIKWQALPNQGLNAGVRSLLVHGNDLYVGGRFTALGDGTDISDGIARYDISTDTWHSLSNHGLDGVVHSLVVDGNDLYVGGSFETLGDGTSISDNIAYYDVASSTWYSLPNQGLSNWGTSGNVRAVALDNKDLYAGGGFVSLGDGTDISDHIARYNITSGTWYSLPNQGLSDDVNTFALYNNDLYVGGYFEYLGDWTAISHSIARYDTSSSSWHPLSNWGIGPPVIGQGVCALTLDGSDLYVGGQLHQLGDGTDISRNLVRYDIVSGTWHSLPGQGLSGLAVYSLLLDGEDLYVGGDQNTLLDGTDISDHITRFDISSNTWHWMLGLLLDNPASDGDVRALTLDGSTLYAGGKFDMLGDRTPTSQNIARCLLTRTTAQAPAPIPEASTLLLLGSGLATFGGYLGLRWRIGRRGMD